MTTEVQQGETTEDQQIAAMIAAEEESKRVKAPIEVIEESIKKPEEAKPPIPQAPPRPTGNKDWKNKQHPNQARPMTHKPFEGIQQQIATPVAPAPQPKTPVDLKELELRIKLAEMASKTVSEITRVFNIDRSMAADLVAIYKNALGL